MGKDDLNDKGWRHHPAQWQFHSTAYFSFGCLDFTRGTRCVQAVDSALYRYFLIFATLETQQLCLSALTVRWGNKRAGQSVRLEGILDESLRGDREGT